MKKIGLWGTNPLKGTNGIHNGHNERLENCKLLWPGDVPGNYRGISLVLHIGKLFTSTISCNIGLMQGESLSPFFYTMYVNDIEIELIKQGCPSYELKMLNLYLLMYAMTCTHFWKFEIFENFEILTFSWTTLKPWIEPLVNTDWAFLIRMMDILV
jgi:hypothetical protein